MSANERTQKLSRAEYAKLGSKWTQPKQEAKPLDRTKLWESLSAYAQQHEAKIISPMHSYPVRLETPVDSELPQKLTEIGYDVIFKSEETRIGGVPSQQRWRYGPIPAGGYGQYVVKVYELDLPRRSNDYTSAKTIAVQ